MRLTKLMIGARVLVLAAILLVTARGMLGETFLNLVPFLVTLPLFWYALKREELALLDLLVMLLFLLSLIMVYFQLWQHPTTLLQMVYSNDKLFHLLAGAILAYAAYLLLRPHITNHTALVVTIVLIAVAIGAFWELFEWLLSILPPPFYKGSTGYADTMLDIAADTVGAAACSLWLRRYL
jgi:uncharacterized membrane protein YjdF